MSKFLNLRDLLRYRKWAIVLSLAVVLVSVGILLFNYATRGAFLYKGIDFTGGLRVMFEYESPIDSRQLQEIRSLFSREARDAKVKTFGLDDRPGRRGLMVTLRGHEIVDQLTRRLYEGGRGGSDAGTLFEEVANQPGMSLFSPELLRANFRVGSGPEEKIDLTRAPRDVIERRAQRIVNEQFSQSVVELLRQQHERESDHIDLNWAESREVQNWLETRQLSGFLRRFRELKQSGDLNSIDSLDPLLEQFSISRRRFESVFTVGEADPDRLDLLDRSPDQIRSIREEEFFRGRYRQATEQIMEARKERGLFRSLDEVFQLPALRDLHQPPLRETAYLSPFVLVRSEMVSPAIGADLIGYALMAILISLVGILAYLYVRFELTYSLGAVAAILHDVVVTVGFLTLIRVEFDVPVVAAVLTVIGYSLNDTIVNFDRVRENRTLMGYDSEWYEVINRSVWEVLNRTIVTSVTTFIAVLVLYVYGGIALRGFSLTLLFGVVLGTYSSIYVSNVVLYLLQVRFYSP